jgi:chemotaxis protein MotB
MTQEQLIRKEDALKKLESDLTLLQDELKNKESSLNDLEKNLNLSRQEMENSRKELEQSQEALEVSQRELKDQQQKLYELQRILTEKDSMVTALRNTVSEALLGFSDKGLKVEERNGKVYVSMENKLLFASGSTAVGAEGRNALVELSKVLVANPEINVMVEGHTDDVPLRGSGQMKDNWDLSVLRATEIVRIILANDKIEPSRITAAGRSQYLPVEQENTAEARARNRRTEIILTPKLDELFRVLESN